MSKEQINCQSCLTANEAAAVNCRNCGAFLSGISAIDPVGSIQAEGELWRKTVKGRPKPFVMIITWILFLPVLLATTAVAIKTILTESGSGGFLVFWFSVGAAIFAFVLLYRVTYNYLTIPKKLKDAPLNESKVKRRLKIADTKEKLEN